MPYLNMAWWKFLLATIVILVTFPIVFPRNYKKILGLELSLKTGIKCFGAFILMMIFSEFYVDLALDHTLIERTPISWLSWWPLQPICQALNEEMLGRAGIFYLLKRYIQKPLTLNFTIAAGFTLLHFIFFWAKEDVTLSLMTNASLFLAAFATNIIFLKTHHIGWVWVLHAGWNARQFGAHYIYRETGRVLSDGEKFNALEGQWPVFFLCLGLFISSCLYVLYIRKTNQAD